METIQIDAITGDVIAIVSPPVTTPAPADRVFVVNDPKNGRLVGDEKYDFQQQKFSRPAR